MTENKRIDRRKGDRHKKPRNLHQIRKEKGLQRVGIYLNSELIERMKDLAIERRVTLGQLIHESFEHTLAKYGQARNADEPIRPKNTEPGTAPTQPPAPDSQPR